MGTGAPRVEITYSRIFEIEAAGVNDPIIGDVRIDLSGCDLAGYVPSGYPPKESVRQEEYQLYQNGLPEPGRVEAGGRHQPANIRDQGIEALIFHAGKEYRREVADAHRAVSGQVTTKVYRDRNSQL